MRRGFVVTIALLGVGCSAIVAPIEFHCQADEDCVSFARARGEPDSCFRFVCVDTQCRPFTEDARPFDRHDNDCDAVIDEAGEHPTPAPVTPDETPWPELANVGLSLTGSARGVAVTPLANDALRYASLPLAGPPIELRPRTNSLDALNGAYEDGCHASSPRAETDPPMPAYCGPRSSSAVLEGEVGWVAAVTSAQCVVAGGYLNVGSSLRVSLVDPASMSLDAVGTDDVSSSFRGLLPPCDQCAVPVVCQLDEPRLVAAGDRALAVALSGAEVASCAARASRDVVGTELYRQIPDRQRTFLTAADDGVLRLYGATRTVGAIGLAGLGEGYLLAFEDDASTIRLMFQASATPPPCPDLASCERTVASVEPVDLAGLPATDGTESISLAIYEAPGSRAFAMVAWASGCSTPVLRVQMVELDLRDPRSPRVLDVLDPVDLDSVATSTMGRRPSPHVLAVPSGLVTPEHARGGRSATEVGEGGFVVSWIAPGNELRAARYWLDGEPALNLDDPGRDEDPWFVIARAADVGVTYGGGERELRAAWWSDGTLYDRPFAGGE
ncbi:MAG: hypothetical protein AB7S26_41325 [Sandaracinaceae bacterium]